MDPSGLRPSVMSGDLIAMAGTDRYVGGEAGSTGPVHSVWSGSRPRQRQSPSRCDGRGRAGDGGFGEGHWHGRGCRREGLGGRRPGPCSAGRRTDEDDGGHHGPGSRTLAAGVSRPADTPPVGGTGWNPGEPSRCPMSVKRLHHPYGDGPAGSGSRVTSERSGGGGTRSRRRLPGEPLPLQRRPRGDRCCFER